MSSVALEQSNPDADGLVGSVTIWPSDVLPSTKYLFAEGQAISRTDYSLLFSRYGELHGVGDGSTTFNLPNLTQRVPAGRDAANTAFDTVGETGGTAASSLPAHTHPTGTLAVNPSSHSHVYVHPTGGGTQVAAAGGNYAVADGGTQSTDAVALSITGSTGSTGSGSGDNWPPYIVVRYIIKVL